MKNAATYRGSTFWFEDEFELLSEWFKSEHGFIVLCKNDPEHYKKVYNVELEYIWDMYFNITQVITYNSDFCDMRIALESDLHGTGLSSDLKMFSEIYIYDAHKMYDNYSATEQETKTFLREQKLERILNENV